MKLWEMTFRAFPLSSDFSFLLMALFWLTSWTFLGRLRRMLHDLSESDVRKGQRSLGQPNFSIMRSQDSCPQILINDETNTKPRTTFLVWTKPFLMFLLSSFPMSLENGKLYYSEVRVESFISSDHRTHVGRRLADGGLSSSGEIGTDREDSPLQSKRSSMLDLNFNQMLLLLLSFRLNVDPLA